MGIENGDQTQVGRVGWTRIEGEGRKEGSRGCLSLSKVLTWILSRPRCGPRPTDWLLDASSWLSETRRDSKPKGGQPGGRDRAVAQDKREMFMREAESKRAQLELR